MAFTKKTADMDKIKILQRVKASHELLVGRPSNADSSTSNSFVFNSLFESSFIAVGAYKLRRD